MQSFSLSSSSTTANKSANPTEELPVVKPKNTSPTHSKAAEAFSRSFTKLQNFNYGSLTKSGKEKDYVKKSQNKEENNFNNNEAGSFKTIEFKSHKFLDMPNKELKGLSIKEIQNTQQDKFESASTAKNPLRSIKTPIFSILNNNRSPEKLTKRSIFTSNRKESTPSFKLISETPVISDDKILKKETSNSEINPSKVTKPSTTNLSITDSHKSDTDTQVRNF